MARELTKPPACGLGWVGARHAAVLLYLSHVPPLPGPAGEPSPGSSPPPPAPWSPAQVLAVPGGTLQQAATQQPMAAPRWPLAEAAALKSLAPVQDAVVVPGSGSGSDDPWVVASCGVAPAGRLARMRMAFGLRPYMADGPEVPVSVVGKLIQGAIAFRERKAGAGSLQRSSLLC